MRGKKACMFTERNKTEQEKSNDFKILHKKQIYLRNNKGLKFCLPEFSFLFFLCVSGCIEYQEPI